MSEPRDCQLPNGGWGWMVVLGVALVNVCNQSLVSMFGLLFGDHLAAMGQATTGAALVININAVFLNFTGLLAGPMLKIYSPRVVCMSGSIMVAVGMMLSSLATTQWQIIVTYGCLVGTGLGLINPAAFIAVNSYFTTKRSRAVGMALAGTGFGQMVMPHIVRALLDEYGFRGTALIMGALSLHGVAGAALFQPVEWHLRTKRLPMGPATDSVAASDADRKVDESIMLLNTSSTIRMFNNGTFTSKPKQSLGAQIMQSMNLKLLGDAIFCNIIVGLALVYSASANFSMILPYFLQDSVRQLSRSDTAMCMSILAAGDLLSRLTLPTLTDSLRIRCRSIFLAGTALLMAARSALAETTGRTALMVMCTVYGFIRAATVVNQSLVVAEYVGGRGRLAGAIGLNMCSRGVFVIVIGQVLSWIRDATDSYALCMHAQNVLMGAVLIAWTSEMVVVNCKTG